MLFSLLTGRSPVISPINHPVCVLWDGVQTYPFTSLASLISYRKDNSTDRGKHFTLILLKKNIFPFSQHYVNSFALKNVLYVFHLRAYTWEWMLKLHINGLVQNCSNLSVLAMELLKFCTKPSIWEYSWNLGSISKAWQVSTLDWLYMRHCILKQYHDLYLVPLEALILVMF